MSKNLNDIIDRMYENFLMRDLSYIFGGCILLGSLAYSLNGELTSIINYITNNVLIFILFLIVAYFIGIITQEGMAFTGLIKTRQKVPEPYEDYIILLINIKKYFGEDAIKYLERIIYLKHIGSSLGASSFIGTVLIFVRTVWYHKFQDFIVLVFMLTFTFICIIENNWKLKQQNEALRHLSEEIFRLRNKESKC